MDGDVDIVDFHTVVEARVISEIREWPDEVDELVVDVANHLISEKKDLKSFAGEVQRIMDIRMEALKALNVTGRGPKELLKES